MILTFPASVSAALLSLILLCLAQGTSAAIKVNVARVLAPGALCAAVDDARGLLVVGDRGASEGQLLVFKLAADGKLVVGQPVRVPLPRRVPVKGYPNYPLSVLFHPRLPVLYVWQDYTGPATVAHEFDHLAIFAIAGSELKLLGTFARGKEYTAARSVGLLGIDPHGERLFVPNLRDPDSSFAALGYFDLEPDGQLAPVPVPIAGSLDGFGLDKFETQLRVTRVTIATDGSFPLLSAGYVVPSPEAAIFGGVSGPATWDTVNRRANLNFVHVPLAGSSTLIAGHPKLPLIYGVSPDDGRKQIFRMRHAGGLLTLLPSTISINDASGFRSAPQVLAGKSRCLAIGGANRVYFAALEESGAMTGESSSIEVANKAVTALAYSTKHNLLYVPVEKLP